MIKEFNFLFNNGNEVHIEFDGNGVAWFYAKEIAKVLGYSHAYNMARMLGDNEIINLPINNPYIPEIALNLSSHHFVMGPSDPTITIINEYAVYRIAFNSRRPEAVDLQNKVFYDILPCIRKYGAYIDANTRAQLEQNPNLIHNINANIDNHEKKRMYHVIDKSRYPYRDFEEYRKHKHLFDLGQAVLYGEENITFNTLAKILSNNLSYQLGEHDIRANLRLLGFLNKTKINYNNPTDKAIKLGVLTMVYSEETDSYITVVTPKGIDYFNQLFLKQITAITE